MTLRSHALRLTCLLMALSWGGSAQANFVAQVQYGLTDDSGGQLQLSTDLPLPLGPVFLGGVSPGVFPPLLVPPASNILTGTTGGGGRLATRAITQTGGTVAGGAIVVPPAVLSRPAPGSPVLAAFFAMNPKFFQVATTISYAWPFATATLAPGGAPGPTVLSTGIAGGIIAYSGGTKSFGGPAQFAIVAGPGAPGGRIPPNGVGALPVASVWLNAVGALPVSAMTVALVGLSNSLGLAQPGASLAAPAVSTMFGVVSPGFGAVNIPVGGAGCTMFCMGPLGTIVSSFPFGGPGVSDMVVASKGFPWTTGLITVSQPNAVGAPIFFLSGTDMRVAGVGNISLVSGALSVRSLSGPGANRGWLSLTLPEPTAALGVAGSLAMLGLCHGLLRRRR